MAQSLCRHVQAYRNFSALAFPNRLIIIIHNFLSPMDSDGAAGNVVLESNITICHCQMSVVTPEAIGHPHKRGQAASGTLTLVEFLLCATHLKSSRNSSKVYIYYKMTCWPRKLCTTYKNIKAVEPDRPVQARGGQPKLYLLSLQKLK